MIVTEPRAEASLGVNHRKSVLRLGLENKENH